MTEPQEVDLSKRENWTPQMIYIHRSRLILGLINGLVFGFVIGVSL